MICNLLLILAQLHPHVQTQSIFFLFVNLSFYSKENIDVSQFHKEEKYTLKQKLFNVFKAILYK